MLLPQTQENEWLKILGKGMVTLPKKWRDDLGIVQGSMIKAYKEGNRVILETPEEKAPYRVYTNAEIDQFLQDDKLSGSVKKRVERALASK